MTIFCHSSIALVRFPNPSHAGCSNKHTGTGTQAYDTQRHTDIQLTHGPTHVPGRHWHPYTHKTQTCTHTCSRRSRHLFPSQRRGWLQERAFNSPSVSREKWSEWGGWGEEGEWPLSCSVCKAVISWACWDGLWLVEVRIPIFNISLTHETTTLWSTLSDQGWLASQRDTGGMDRRRRCLYRLMPMAEAPGNGHMRTLYKQQQKDTSYPLPKQSIWDL